MANALLSGNLGANNAQAITDVGNNTMFSAVVTGTFVGTITLQVLYDTAEGWITATCFTRAGASASAVLTAPGNRLVNTAGAVAVRALMNPYTSGTAEVTLAGAPAIGAAASGSGGGAATVADGGDVNAGTTTDAGVTGDTAGTMSAKLRGINTEIGILTEAAPASDTASSGLNGRLQRIAQNITTLIGRLPAALVGGRLDVNVGASALPTGAALDATVGTTNTEIGGLTETAPASDTASSGLNGRLQRVAQRLTSLIALLPSALISNRLDVNLGAAPVTVTTQGGAAANAALAGNPNRTGISDGTNIQDWKQGTNGFGLNAATGIGEVAAMLQDNSAGYRNAAAASADAMLNGSVAAVNAADYNGASMDRHRGNIDSTLLASAARTTTQSGTITTYNLGAIKFILDMTTVGTGSVTLTINEVDLASGKSILLLSGAAVTTNSTNEYTVDPMIPAVANVSAQKRVTRQVAWTVTANNANSATYSLGTMQLPA